MDGYALYGNIHSARPPLIIYPLAICNYIGLPFLFSARLTVMLSVLITAILLFLAGSKIWNLRVGVISFIIFLLSPEVASRHVYTGISTVSLFSTMCVICALMKHPVIAGIAAGLAILSGQHSFIVVTIVGLYLLCTNYRSLLFYILTCLPTVFLITLIVYVFGGKSIWYDLIGHHLYHMKSDVNPSNTNLKWWIITWCLENIHIIIFTALAVMLAMTNHLRRKTYKNIINDPIFIISLIALVHFIIIILMRGGMILYIHPIIPLLALVSGAGISSIIDNAMFKNTHGENQACNAYHIVSMIFVIFVATIGGWAAALERYENRDHRRYSFIPNFRYVEMNNIQRPIVADKIASMINEDNDKKGTIFGYGTISSLVALKTNRHVSAELADFAPRWLDMGIMSKSSVVNAIEKDNVEYFITPGLFFIPDNFFRSYIEKCYEKPSIFQRESGSGIPRIFVFKHLEDKKPCLPNRNE